MKIACVQYDIAWEDPYANYATVRSMLGASGLPPGSLAILPEMFSTGFSMNVAGIDDGPTQETQQVIADFACRMGIYLIGGVVTRGSDGRGRNQAVVCDPSGAIIARYHKMQPFSPGGESQHYTAGDDIVLFQWNRFTVCPLICYDLRFPEIFRSAVRRGANLFVVIASWPQTRLSHWIALLRARAIENQAYVAGVNRIGNDPKYSYNGGSLIIDPRGEILADAGSSPGMISADVDFDGLTTYRSELPFLEDIRGSL